MDGRFEGEYDQIQMENEDRAQERKDAMTAEEKARKEKEGAALSRYSCSTHLVLRTYRGKLSDMWSMMRSLFFVKALVQKLV